MKKKAKRRSPTHVYNVCAYQADDERIMKETLTASGPVEAMEIGVFVLRENGFKPSQLRIEVIPLAGDIENNIASL